MKKNRIIATLAVVLSVTPLTLKIANAATNTNKLLVWEDIKKSSGITDAIHDFEKKYSIKVNIIELPFSQQIEKLRLDGPAGIGPDVLVIPNDQLGGAVVQGLITPLKVNHNYIDKYTKSAVTALNYKDKQYGIPKAVESIVMIYNKKLVKTPPKDFDTIFSISEKFHKEGKYGLLAKFDEVYYTYGVMSAMGGYIFGHNKDGSFNFDDIGFNNKGSIEAAAYIKKFYSTGLFPTGILGSTGLNAIDSMFTEGKAAIVFNGPWAFKPYENAGVDYGVAPLPILPNGKHMRSLLGVKGYVVSSYSKQQDLALKFIKFINQPKYEKIRFAKTGEIPALKSLVNDPEFNKNAGAVAVAEQAKYATAMPNNPEFNTIWTPVNNALQLIATNKSQIKPALDNAVNNIKMQIQMTQAEQ
ncbi:extracellular solute-binding protein [Celerinatantimonas sp. MCCC 1A17872]|uniref:extracellular solute-binding protein n=1 Tax=Celerinatantimonas sp. MCCC 1A17872 TaxID=3177514 RepID=UPI0038C1DAC5